MALIAAASAAALCATPTFARADCRSTGFSAETFGNPDYTLSLTALAGNATPPDVLIDQTTTSGRRIVRMAARDGRTRWKGALTGGGGGLWVTGPRSAETALVLRAGDGCGDVFVSGIEVGHGKVTWRAHLPEFSTDSLPDVSVFSLPPADWNHDGIGDLAVLRVAVPRLVPVYATCAQMPSGHCTAPGMDWHAIVTVLDGKRGHSLLTRDLGDGSGPQPTIAWTGSGSAVRLAVAVPAGAGNAAITLYAPGRSMWTATAPSGLNDLALAPVTNGVAVIGTSATTYATILGGVTQVSMLDIASGATRWSQVVPGPVFLKATRSGDLLVVNLAASLVQQINGRTGATGWQQPIGEPLHADRYPYFVGDLDRRGSPDLALALASRNVVVSSETGTILVSLPSAERPFAARDLTGDDRDDLVSIANETSTSPTVALRSGASQTPVWSTGVTLAHQSTGLNVTASGGRDGLVLVYAVNGEMLALDARAGKTRWRTTQGV